MSMNTNQIKQWLQSLPYWVKEVPVCDPVLGNAWGALLHFTGTSNVATPLRVTFDQNKWRVDREVHTTIMNMETSDIGNVTSKYDELTTFFEQFQANLN